MINIIHAVGWYLIFHLLCSLYLLVILTSCNHQLDKVDKILVYGIAPIIIVMWFTMPWWYDRGEK